MTKRLTTLAVALLLTGVFATLRARPLLHDLQIHVVLSPNGDARITETRQMDIDLEGTECYIVVGNLPEGSHVSDLQVSDETGNEYRNVGEWDVSMTRQEKYGLCGIVTKSNGYELCWGLGNTGSRTYVTSYTVSNLLRAYSDADGFNYMFVAEGLDPRPDHVRLTIEPAAPAKGVQGIDSVLTVENTGVWAFRYRGEVNVVNGTIVAETSEPFSSGSAMIVMARFNKGIFSPAITENGSFEQVSERAFENSDYLIEEGPTKEDLLMLAALVFFIIFAPIALIAGYFYYVWKARKKVNKDLLWYRDIPANGNLQWANEVQNAYRYVGTDYNNLLSAAILKLIDLKAISIDRSMNEKGKVVEQFVIHPLNDAAQQPKLLSMVHDIFRNAAGDDAILQPKELRRWMKKKDNQTTTDAFIQLLHTKRSIRHYKNQLDEVRQLFGLKKFLKEFSLIDERHVQEVALWKDYMVYATLFGIANQVIKDMKAVNPEYFELDQVAQQMSDTMTLPMIQSAFHSSTMRAATSKAQREARASGRGGSSSWGGGGGFSGGGFGGGVR